MEEVFEYKTFTALKPHFESLAIVAYYKIVTKEVSRRKRFIHNVFRVIICTLVVGYNLQHIIKVIQVRHNVDHIVDTLFILLTTINTLGKQILFNLRSSRVEKLIEVMKSPIFAPKNEDQIKILKKNAALLATMLKSYQVAVLLCGVLWTVFPFVKRAFGEEVRLTGYIPFDTSESPNFEIAVFYMSVLINLQGFANVTMDCTIVALSSQAKTQIELLRYNYEHLVDLDKGSKIMATSSRYNQVNERTLKKRFINCNEHYRQIVWFAKESESIFQEAMILQFSASAWVICMTVYKIVGLNIFSMEFVSMAVYLCCMLAQLFIHCYYGTQLTYASEFIGQSLYSGDWLSVSPRFWKQFLMMMQFCSQPITPSIAVVIPVSLETYILILRCSYTFFTLLNNSRK